VVAAGPFSPALIACNLTLRASRGRDFVCAVATSTVRVRDELQHAILEGILKPGERLRAEALAQRYGTSRTPVREALLQLEAQGLVEVEPNRGAVVRPFDAADLRDLYDVRALLEPAAAGRAATRIGRSEIEHLIALCDDDATVETQIACNESFHRVIADAAGSPRLTAALRAASGIPRAFRSIFWHDPDQRAESLMCHRRLIDAFEAHDAQLAEAVMRMHILGAIAFLERTWPNR
jgi:DNA-binding GntR family transcriptional regulator